eukprot:PhF_6_TR24023/c0_g1_i1/m.33639
MSENLEKELAFYGAYHSHPLNKAVHAVTVPLIFSSALIGLRNVGNTGKTISFLRGNTIPVNIPTMAVGAYAAYYVYLDPVSGLLWLVLQGVPILLLSNLSVLKSVPHLTASAWGFHALCWFIQVSIGHGVFEKRKPALLDSLVQAFLTAPLFVMLETLMPLGYKKDLAQRVHERSKKIQQELDAKKKLV